MVIIGVCSCKRVVDTRYEWYFGSRYELYFIFLYYITSIEMVDSPKHSGHLAMYNSINYRNNEILIIILITLALHFP